MKEEANNARRFFNEDRQKEIEMLKNYKMEEKIYKAERQRTYKVMLDDQLKVKSPYFIKSNNNDSFYTSQIIENKIFPSTLNQNEINMDDHSYQHKTNLYNVNPCKIFIIDYSQF